jgi:hypothetical protein
MSDEIKLLKDTIHLLIETLQKPVTELNHVEKMAVIKAAEGVCERVGKVPHRLDYPPHGSIRRCTVCRMYEGDVNFERGCGG